MSQFSTNRSSKILDIFEGLKISKVSKKGIADLKKMDTVLKGWEKVKAGAFDKASYIWSKDGIAVATYLYPPNSYNVSIGKLIKKIPSEGDLQMFFLKNVTDRKILQNFGKAKIYDGIDKWEYLLTMIKELE